MLLPTLELDAAMSVAVTQERLARNGFWRGDGPPHWQRRIASTAQRLAVSESTLRARHARDARVHGIAIRRQLGSRVLWYAMRMEQVLDACLNFAPTTPLLQALDLHESDSVPAVPLPVDWAAPLLPGSVLLEGSRPVAVWLNLVDGRDDQQRRDADSALETRYFYDHDGATRAAVRGTGAAPPAPASRGAAPAPDQSSLAAWPRIEAPTRQPAEQPFDVRVGLGSEQQAGLTARALALPVRPGQTTITLTIELSAGPELEAPNGWERTLELPVADLGSRLAEFRLTARRPGNTEGITLTMLEIRYLVEGTVCGTAAWPLVIFGSDAPAATVRAGREWSELAPPLVPISLVADPDAPDLTIELTKPDRNASSGHYSLRLSSPHNLRTARGPFRIDLGEDARTFARSLVDEVRLFGASELLEQTIESMGRLVADRLPPAIFDAIREVAARTAPQPPAVLFVSAEPYVPWELAWMDAPLDEKLPSCLAAQVLLGRWLRDENTVPSDTSTARPELHPRSDLQVGKLAVMVAWYRPPSGMSRLPKAEEEGKALVQRHDGVPLPANAIAMRQLLAATVDHGFERVRVDAVHFAGHGNFDPTAADGTSLYLDDGTPIRSNLFRAARYGGAHQPLMFLNACMSGVGSTLLGDMGGVPGNALRGGFGGVVGALWEVDDGVAHDLALEFWRRALPPAPARGEPVAAILRDLRARYVPGTLPAPVSTYLAYVYYGHPKLSLTRRAA